MEKITIVVDSREKNSKIPGLLSDQMATFSFSNLSAGDYMINNQILIERKTAQDFIQSLLDNRLFDQCLRLKKWDGRVLILIEGNPFATGRHISEEAIRGALTSIMAVWQIPMMHTRSEEETVRTLINLGKQAMPKSEYVRLRKGIKPKRVKNQTLCFLQGLPAIGPKIAGRLIAHFGNIKTVINADVNELIPG